MSSGNSSRSNQESEPQRHRYRGVNCPGCHNLLNASVAMVSDGRMPTPGDYTVCDRCGTVLKFDSDIRPTIEVTPDMLFGMPKEQLEVIFTAQYHLAMHYKARQN